MTLLVSTSVSRVAAVVFMLAHSINIMNSTTISLQITSNMTNFHMRFIKTIDGNLMEAKIELAKTKASKSINSLI